MPHVKRDGVKLFYEETGVGGPPMVFVHGWCCNRTHFAAQVAHFAPSYRCISLDLRGHGDSDKPEGAYSIAGFADDVAWLCGQIGARKPVIVGHSMGGAVALSLAARYAELPAAIVMLDGAIFPPPALLAMTEPLAAAFASPGYAEALRALFEQMFMATDDAGRRAAIVAKAVETPQHVVAAEWAALWGNDSAADASACGVPALYVGSHAPVADMAALRAAMPNAVLAQTAGAGHFHQLEVPEQVNAMIERFLAISL
jgi:pimeloyl-ACP methyl ester carboxylesterase